MKVKFNNDRKERTPMEQKSTEQEMRELAARWQAEALALHAQAKTLDEQANTVLNTLARIELVRSKQRAPRAPREEKHATPREEKRPSVAEAAAAQEQIAAPWDNKGNGEAEVEAES